MFIATASYKTGQNSQYGKINIGRIAYCENTVTLNRFYSFL